MIFESIDFDDSVNETHWSAVGFSERSSCLMFLSISPRADSYSSLSLMNCWFDWAYKVICLPNCSESVHFSRSLNPPDNSETSDCPRLF